MELGGRAPWMLLSSAPGSSGVNRSSPPESRRRPLVTIDAMGSAPSSDTSEANDSDDASSMDSGRYPRLWP